jgi:hypothetical protein
MSSNVEGSGVAAGDGPEGAFPPPTTLMVGGISGASALKPDGAGAGTDTTGTGAATGAAGRADEGGAAAGAPGADGAAAGGLSTPTAGAGARATRVRPLPTLLAGVVSRTAFEFTTPSRAECCAAACPASAGTANSPEPSSANAASPTVC